MKKALSFGILAAALVSCYPNYNRRGVEDIFRIPVICNNLPMEDGTYIGKHDGKLFAYSVSRDCDLPGIYQCNRRKMVCAAEDLNEENWIVYLDLGCDDNVEKVDVNGNEDYGYFSGEINKILSEVRKYACDWNRIK